MIHELTPVEQKCKPKQLFKKNRITQYEIFIKDNNLNQMIQQHLPKGEEKNGMIMPIDLTTKLIEIIRDYILTGKQNPGRVPTEWAKN